MSDCLSRAMHHAVSDTLENMAFLEACPTGATPDASGDEMVAASLLMHDPVQGMFRLIMPRGLLLRIVESIYAMPLEELSEQVIMDTLAEILNTITGQFLNAIIPGEVYRLGLPEIVTPWEEPLANGFMHWNFEVDGTTLVVEVNGESLPTIN